jgi:Protein of unknown function (DUF416)
MSNFSKQLDKIESICNKLKPVQAYTFGVYEKCAINKKWDKSHYYRQMLDDIWDWLIDKKPIPAVYSQTCEDLIIDEIEDDNDTFGSEISVSFFNLIFSIENGKANDTYQTIKHSLNTIDFLLSDFVLVSTSTNSHELIIDSHELVKNEILEEDFCVEMILSPNFSVETIEILRKRATGQSIFGNYWFD